jgi:hypothetical protein
MPRRVVCLLLAAVFLAACGGDDGNGTDVAENPPDEITGVIVAIDSERLGEVDSFDVKDGDTITTLYIDPDIEYPFPLGHLHEHLETAQPVKCDVEFLDGKLYARTIEDA